MLSRVLESPALWLTAFVTISALVRGTLASRVPSPSILPDEVLYSELAKSVAEGSLPAVRGLPALGWGVVYPTLIAPAWLMFDDPVRAYHAALAINALLMSLAALPAYFLARMFVSRKLSLVVAGSTILVPSMVYTGVLMTENAFYPVFLLVLLLIARTVRQPRILNQALVVLALAVLTLTRIQGVVIFVAYLGAALVYAAREHTSARAYLRRFRPSIVVTLLGAVVLVFASIARGDGVLGLLGARIETITALEWHELPVWHVLLAADLVLYLAAAPILATIIVVARGLSHSASEPVRLFAAVGGAAFLALLVSVSVVSASLNVDGFENLNERYVFYLAPLAFIGLALWVEEALPRPRPWALLAIIACCLTALTLPVQRLEYNARFQSPALLPWMEIPASEAAIAALIGGCVLLCGLLWLTCRPDCTRILWLVTCSWMLLAGALAVDRNESAATLVAGSYSDGKATWVDEAVSRNADVRVVWDERGAVRGEPDPLYGRLLVTEFFNRSVGDFERIGDVTHYENVLPTVPVRASRDSTLRDVRGRPVDAAYVLTTCRTQIAGDVVAQASGGRLALVRVDGPIRIIAVGWCP